jgi:hypothetical protein
MTAGIRRTRGGTMSNKHDKEQRRKTRLCEREAAERQRTAAFHDGVKRAADGVKRAVARQGGDRGYDVRMIRDFLDHLLLALRVQHFENRKLLKALGSADDLGAAMKVTEEISPKLVEQIAVYLLRYRSVLLPSDVAKAENASETEVRAVMTAVLEVKSAKRDEQIGHLEALRDLFAEALDSASLPVGLDPHGNLVHPQVVHDVRQLVDRGFLSRLPG